MSIIRKSQKWHDMDEKFPITVAPLKSVYSSFTEIRTWAQGYESQTRYVQTPYLYVVDNANILPGVPNWTQCIPHYIGESKNKWLIGYVYLDVLAKKYPEDEFIRRCLDQELRFEDSEALVEWGETVFTGVFSQKTTKERKFVRQTIAEIAEIWDRKRKNEAILVRILTPVKIKYKTKIVGFLHLYNVAYIVPP